MCAQIFLDTHILIGALRRRFDTALHGASIASITALEFFGMQGTKRTQATYYVPLLRRVEAEMFEVHPARRDHPFSRYRTDSIVMNFGTDFPSLIEYGNLAIAEVLNQRRIKLFEAAIDHFDKAKRKALRSKIELLLTNDVVCVPLTKPVIGIAHRLLESFGKHNEVKRHFRNTWNDMLIAATAAETGGRLVTEDSLLQRHIGLELGARVAKDANSLSLDFGSSPNVGRVKQRESKGYINRPWTVHFRQARAAISRGSI